MRHLLLSGGPGPGHDFDASAAVLAELVDAIGASTTVVHEPAEAAEQLRSAADRNEPWDLFTVNALRWRMDQERFADQRSRWAVSLSDGDAEVFEQHVRKGGGLLALHTAVLCFDGHETWRRLLGGVWDWDRSSHPPLGDVVVRPTAAGTDHPVTAELGELRLRDELYSDLDLADDVVPLASGRVDSAAGATQPVLWAREHGAGRVVTSLLGHGTDSLGDPQHRRLLTRAALWCATARSVAGAAP